MKKLRSAKYITANFTYNPPLETPVIDQIIKNIIRSEGGYVNDPDDKGGATKYGITKPALSNHLGREVEDIDIINLSHQEAADIYEQHYFHYPRIDELPETLHPIML